MDLPDPGPPVYDIGESFAAGDEMFPQFDNDRLIALVAVAQVLVPDPDMMRRVRRAILREIFGDVEDR